MAPVQGVQVRAARSLITECHDEGEDNARMSSKRACTSAHLQLHKSFTDQRTALISERLLNLLNAGLHWTDRHKETEASSACRMTAPARLLWLPPRKGPAWGQTVAGGLRPEPAGRSFPAGLGARQHPSLLGYLFAFQASRGVMDGCCPKCCRADAVRFGVTPSRGAGPNGCYGLHDPTAPTAPTAGSGGWQSSTLFSFRQPGQGRRAW